MGSGRTKLQIQDLPSNWKELFIEWGKKGKNQQDLYPQLKISHATFRKMVKREPEFNKMFLEYQKLHENYWMNVVQESLRKNGGIDIDTKLWVLLMGNKQRAVWKRQ